MIIAMASLAELIRQYFGLDPLVSEAVASVITFAFVMIVVWAGYIIFHRCFTRWAEKTETKLDDEILRNIKAPIFLLAIFAGTYYSLVLLTSLQPYSELLAAIFTVAEILIVTFTITRIANVLSSWYAEKSAQHGKQVSNHLLFVLKKVIQACIYMFGFLAILVVFRIDLSGVVVGLGIGGIAIALALQNILADAFSAFSIYFDRPFEIGDFIVVGNYSGTVTKIGLKSTRVQLLQGEELIISNKELTATSVRNFKKLKKRRIVFTVGVAYDTSLEKLKKIPQIISDIIAKIDMVEFDRVHFTAFGDFSLKFEIVYCMKTADYNKYMDTQQEINFAIKGAFETEGIKMAYPTQRIYLEK
jgi:small-conductance mechanosensitive channel